MPFTVRNDLTGELFELPDQPAAGMSLPGFTIVNRGEISNFGGQVPFHSNVVDIGQFRGLFQTTPQTLPTVPGVAGDLLNQGICALFPGLSSCEGVFPNNLPNPFQSTVPPTTLLAPCPPTGPCPPGKELRTIKARAASTICAKKPRMNVLNPRALRRAAKRLGGFQKEVKAVEKIINKALPRKTARRASSGRCGTCRQSPCGC